MAYAVDALMIGLGFRDGYVAQGGDIGSFVARILGAKFSAKAVHSELCSGCGPPLPRACTYCRIFSYSQFRAYAAAGKRHGSYRSD